MANAATPAPAPRAQPVHEVRLGTIKAAIWRNDTESGVRHNVTFERLYNQDNEWRSTGSFGRDDLLVLAKVADLAHTWIAEPDASAVGISVKSDRAPASDLTGKSLPKRPTTPKAGQ